MSKKLAAGPQNLLRARNGEAPQLLLAEDSPAARILTAALLRRMGCSGDEAEHGEEALEAVRSRAYHTIILDIEMPEKNGFELFKHFHNIPFDVIFTTAGAESSTSSEIFSGNAANKFAHIRMLHVNRVNNFL